MEKLKFGENYLQSQNSKISQEDKVFFEKKHVSVRFPHVFSKMGRIDSRFEETLLSDLVR